MMTATVKRILQAVKERGLFWVIINEPPPRPN